MLYIYIPESVAEKKNSLYVGTAFVFIVHKIIFRIITLETSGISTSGRSIGKKFHIRISSGKKITWKLFGTKFQIKIFVIHNDH